MGKLMYHSHAILHFTTIILVMGFVICTAFATNTTSFGCFSGERKALLKLKASFEDPANRLSSWHTNTDCCMWKGVVCDNNTGHVVGLHLGNTYSDPLQLYDDEILIYNHSLRSNHLDSSLSELKYLSYLDLSGNDFQLSSVPAFLGSMKQLQLLNLSYANFSGVVPYNLGNLSSLRVLDLSNIYETGKLMADDLNHRDLRAEGPRHRYEARKLMADDLIWASNLPCLEHLDMSGVDLSRAKHLSEVLFHMLPSILVLRLSYTQLNNTHLPHSCVNSSLLNNIQHLDLSGNSFHGELPCFLRNTTSLRVLDLSENHYNSSSPYVLLRLRNLVSLDLSFNLLHHTADWISESLLNKCHLKSLSLAYNNFFGELSGSLFRNLPMGYCWTHKLETLDLGGNTFTGSIPASIGKLRGLRHLSLYNNRLSGEFPISLGQLSDLEMIDIYNNSFNGTLSEIHFAKLSKLEVLSASSINLSVAFDWVPPFQLKELNLLSCEIGGGQSPQWLRTQKALKSLTLRNCGISGSLSEWLHYIPNYLNLKQIDLSYNVINGSIPKLPPCLKHLQLSHNHIEGPIPKFHSNLVFLGLSDNMIDGSIPDSLCQVKALVFLDLSRNHFSGNIPNCWANLLNLYHVRLSSNNLSGVIPNSLGECRHLTGLHLNNNSLTGQLPHALKNCGELVVLDVGDNQLTEELPDWIGSVGWESSIYGLRVLRLRNNEFYGEIPSTFCQLEAIQVLDLADNKLTGNIPHCFGNFSGMRNFSWSGLEDFGFYWYDLTLTQVLRGKKQDYTTTSPLVVNLDLSKNSLVGEIPPQLTNLSSLVGLNLSHNHLVGKIPSKIGDMKQLESLDLSSNRLFGTIPESLSGLSFLTSLNLSHNNLSGRIPKGNQLQTLENPISIYGGNPGLCGDPLPKRCPDDEAPKSPNVDGNEGTEDEDDKNDKIIFYGMIASGFATGFWGIIGFMVLKRSWRLAFFQFAEDVMHKMLNL